jgi:hypothetical protein
MEHKQYGLILATCRLMLIQKTSINICQVSINIAHENLYFELVVWNYIKKSTYAIEVHRASAWLKLLGWARTLTQHIDQLIELVAMIHCLCFFIHLFVYPWLTSHKSSALNYSHQGLDKLNPTQLRNRNVVFNVIYVTTPSWSAVQNASRN